MSDEHLWCAKPDWCLFREEVTRLRARIAELEGALTRISRLPMLDPIQKAKDTARAALAKGEL